MMKKVRAEMTMGKIPPEVMQLIFVKLPTNDILRCKRVCKIWLSLISDLVFVEYHLNTTKEIKSHKRCILIDCDRIKADGKSVKLPFHQNKQVFTTTDLEFFSSCNGLLLVGTREKDHFLWNPSTGSYVHIFSTDRIVFFWDLRLYGLGYDSVTGTYKVVRILRNETIFADVYNCKTKCWKSIRDFPYEPVSDGQGTIFKGAPHWIVTRKEKENTYVIIYFDVTDDLIKEVKTCLPNWLVKGSKFTFGVLDGLLCLLNNSPDVADVWVMNDDWIRLVNMCYIKPPTYYLYRNIFEFCCRKTNEMSFMYTQDKKKQKIVYKNRVVRTSNSCSENRRVDDDDAENEIMLFDGPAVRYVFHSIGYVATLVSPN